MISPMLEQKLKELRTFSHKDHTFTLITVASPAECSACHNSIFPSRPAYRVSESGRESGIIHPGCLGRVLGKA